ncbi:zinc ribbon domain-containing protein [Phascolarctobacterium succinatutens]
MKNCLECGNHMDRDINAAINIRNEGMKQLVSARL